MNSFEELQDEACKDGVEIIENYAFKSDRIRGLYSNNTIALNKNLKNTTEKYCVLAEELGHHYTAVGNIVDQSSVENRKQEMKGRILAYDKLVGLCGIINANNHHCKNTAESAEYLGVTEEFLCDALSYYKRRYGTYTTVDNYVIIFEPYIAVIELI